MELFPYLDGEAGCRNRVKYISHLTALLIDAGCRKGHCYYPQEYVSKRQAEVNHLDHILWWTVKQLKEYRLQRKLLLLLGKQNELK
jgi:hypothetical protein